MTGTERKRHWRLLHPNRSREAERWRAQARRDGFWGVTLGREPRACASSDSYSRYENTTARYKQRLFYRRYGPGAHRLSREEFHAAAEAVWAEAMANTREILARLETVER
jgi:hypothetical protein